MRKGTPTNQHVKREPVRGAKKLLAFRNRMGLSQEKAGKQLRVSGPTIHDWETGTKRPQDHNRDRISVWTGGEIVPDDWKYADEKASTVKPCVPTGTEG